MRIFKRIIYLLLFPAKEWKTIAAENNNRKTVYVQFVVPLLCMITIATIAGTWFSTSRELYSAGYVFSKIGTLWVSLSAGLFVSAFCVSGITEEKNRDFELITYSLAATYLVIIIVSLFPFFPEFLVLAFYSFYLFWQGIPHLISVESERRMKYGLLSLTITVLVHSLMYFLFSNIFKAIFL